jgi:hypothetical protein
MVPVIKNVQTMLYPVKSEKLSGEECVQDLIDEVLSGMYRILGDNPTPEATAHPNVRNLQKRLLSLQAKKKAIVQAKKNRKRHQGQKDQTITITVDEWTNR